MLNGHRIMWVFVLFDLPMETDKERKAYNKFRRELLNLGFSHLQHSVYIRHCPTRAVAQTYMEKVGKLVPEDGHIMTFTITDNQFGKIKHYWGVKKYKKKDFPPNQLPLIFD